MRNRFDRQLLELNNELIQMGSLIEQAIEMGISALVKQDVEKAEQAIKFDVEVDEQEKTIESLHETAASTAAGSKRLKINFRSIKNDHGHGAYRRSCSGYFGDDHFDGRFRL